MNEPSKNNFSPNSAINSEIINLLRFFNQTSQQKMRKAIHAAKKSAVKHGDENTDANARHIFREFIPAVEFNKKCFAFEYEKPIMGKKPDWLDESAKIMLDSYTFERGGTSSFPYRVIDAVSEKCNKYKEVLTINSLRFIVSVYLDFLTAVSVDECRENIESFRPLFDSNLLWAIIFFTETRVINHIQQYEFLCLSSDSPSKLFPNWPFNTININE